MANPNACWACGAVGKCFPGCGCRKCVDPFAYRQYMRNLPGDNSSKAQADRENRIRLELNGQQRMQLWNGEQMFSALQNKCSLILVRGLEGFKSVKDGISMLRLANALLRELNPLTKELIEFTKEEAACQ